VAESEHRLETNNIFTNVVVSLLPAKYQFLRPGYVILYPQPSSATDGYPSFAGHLFMLFQSIAGLW